MNDFFKKYLDNQCHDDDFDAAIDLLLSPSKRGELNKQMQQHWVNTSGEGDVPDLKNTLHGIHYQINKREKVKKLNFVNYFSRAAAILILPLCIALTYLAVERSVTEIQMQTVFAPLASRTSFDLPDGSQVWLNAGSTLSFPTNFSEKLRSVKLTGQAYFDVEKDEVPFEIETESFKVNVLGTAFDVSAYKGEVPAITLVRGQVEVETNNGAETILKPGEQASVYNNAKSIHKKEVDTYLVTAWKDNLLIFENELFKTAVPRLERWYNVDIVIGDDAINNIPLNGTFQFEGISEILQLIEITNSITYTFDREERKLILKLK